MENGTEELLEIAETPEGEAAAKPQKKFSLAAWLYDWVETLIFALIFVTVVFSLLFRIVGVDGESMMDTLQPNDRLILSNLFYKPDYGDIVVVYRDEEQEPLIKRVIGKAGDTIRLDTETNTVYRNGVALEEPYVNYPLYRNIEWDEDGEVVVPENHLFVLGDHRNLSKDSRSCEIQMVNEECVMGRAFFRIYPLDAIGTV